MPLVTIETMTSSVLRDANNSLMAGHQGTPPRDGSTHGSDFLRHRNWDNNGILTSDTEMTYDSLFSTDQHKHEVLNFSFNTAKTNVFSDENHRRTHSLVADPSSELNFPPLISQIGGDNDACQSLVSFHSLYTNNKTLMGGEPLVFTGGNDIQMDVSLPSTAYSSRAGTPSSYTGTHSKRESPCVDMFSNFDVGDPNFERSYLNDGAKADLFSGHDFLAQDSSAPEFKFDAEQLAESAYLPDDTATIRSHETRGGKSLHTNPMLRRDLDMHSAPESLDGLDSSNRLYDSSINRLHNSNSRLYNSNSRLHDDSDLSNTSSDFSMTRYSSPAPQLQHLHNNSAESIKYNFRQATSTPASDSLSVPSPSSSHTAGDSTRTSPIDTRLYNVDDQQAGVYQNGVEEMVAKMKVKGPSKLRGAQNLPPCRVCGNIASGLHFGVNTCEACNEFFRRSLKRGATYYCSKNRECQVYGKKRNACSYCRYHRCVEMGMSREAIKTGRYSHKTRTEYAMEVEKVKQKEVNRVEKEKYESLLTDLVKYHDKYVKVSTRVSDEELYKNQKTYLELYCSQREHERRHPPLVAAVQNKQLMGDWTAAKEDVSLTIHDVEMTELWLRNYISFAKNVPGFKKLALSDQASLVRGSWFEFWFLGAFRGYNSRINVVAYPNGRCFHRDEIEKVFGKEYTDFSFYLAERMRSLDVTPEIMVLIKTVCLTFPDRTQLENKEAVDKMHWLMVSCLLHTLEKNKPGDSGIFPLVVSKLVELRTLTDIAMRAHKSALYQDVLKDKPLMYEMVDTTTHYVQCEQKNVVSIKNCV